MIDIKKVKYKDLPQLNQPYINFDAKGNYYVLLEDGELAAVAYYRKMQNRYRLDGNLTFERFRGKGYMTLLLQVIMEDIPEGAIIDARCLETSWKIYERLGFDLIEKKQYKTFDIYVMERKK
jgi:predicted GNAT family acetyltransferase